MKIGKYDIKPVLLYLPDEKKYADEHEAASIYLAERGIWDAQHIAGIHAHKFGIQGTHIYLLDNRAHEQFNVGPKNVGCFVSHYILYSCMNVMPDNHFMVLETDMRFAANWQKRLDAAMADVPEDFDFLFVGSCCAADKEPVHVKGEVYEFPYRGEEKWDWYPQCGHCYIVAKKCIPYLIATQRDCASPIDISLIKHSFPLLKVYAVLPRIADQGEKTQLPE